MPLRLPDERQGAFKPPDRNIEHSERRGDCGGRPEDGQKVVTFPAFKISDPEKSRVPHKIKFDMNKSPAQGGGVQFEDESYF